MINTKIHLEINKIPNDPKVIFLETVRQGLLSGKVWENRIFLSCVPLVGPYRKPPLIRVKTVFFQ